MEHPLGWIRKEDERDATYPMSRVLSATAPSRRKTRNWWMPPTPLNQGLSPYCVGATAEHWLRGDPHRTTDAWRMEQIYWASRERDDLDDAEYPDGTTLRGALKFLQEDNRVGEYLWAESHWDVEQWVLHRGPVWIGTSWYESMDWPNEHHLVNVEGGIRGGHAVLLRGVDTRIGLFRFRNSWGKGYGLKGDAYLRASDLEWLLAEGHAEAVGVTELPRV